MTLRRKVRIATVSVFALACCMAFVASRGAGRWLVREDPLAKADEIVVLSGTMPARAEEAGRVFQMGYAPIVWVSLPTSPRDELTAMGIPYSGEEDYSRAVLIHEGVPAAGIKIFAQPIVNTENEIEEISQQMRRDGKTSAIIGAAHPARARSLEQDRRRRFAPRGPHRAAGSLRRRSLVAQHTRHVRGHPGVSGIAERMAGAAGSSARLNAAAPKNQSRVGTGIAGLSSIFHCSHSDFCVKSRNRNCHPIPAASSRNE